MSVWFGIGFINVLLNNKKKRFLLVYFYQLSLKSEKILEYINIHETAI